MREVESAIWTSGEPVSLSPRLCSAISLPLTSVSVAKPTGNYTEAGLTSVLGGPLDGAVRTGIRSSSPGPWPVDENRVRVAQRVVFGGHQLDRETGALKLDGPGVVRFHGNPGASGLDPDPGSRNRLGGFKPMV